MSSLKVFQVKKVSGAGSEKIFAMKVLKKVSKQVSLYLIIFSCALSDDFRVNRDNFHYHNSYFLQIKLALVHLNIGPP